jgi:hypothetical protein
MQAMSFSLPPSIIHAAMSKVDSGTKKKTHHHHESKVSGKTAGINVINASPSLK